MKYTIYLRTNLANGKQYVGQTSNFKQRQREWNCLKRIYANGHIDDDRAKYGFDAWVVKVLAECDNREDAWNLEQRFIKDYNTLWPNGYNLDSGGEMGKKHSDETKKKMSEAQKGEKHPMYGKHHSEEAKQKMSEAHKGTHHTEEAKQKIREGRSKQVYQYTLDGELIKIWPSTMEIQRELGYFNSNISRCCYGKRKTSNGYIWSYNPL